ncbi:MAG TPA: TonB-dependent receptor plug domain-containing protein, partial [Labilithrix sp.]|nr:TonB-dependent receptor plug domain-containing protein [Labilithrix sp.]
MATEGARRFGAVVAASLLVVSARARADEVEPPAPAAPPPAAPQDDAVTVRGSKADNLERSTGSSSQVSKTEIAHAQPQSSSEVFRRVPGLNVRSEDGMGLRLNLGVRGLNPTRGRLVLLQEDGVPVVVSPYGEPELYYSTPVERIERVDVLKGHEVVLYGPQTVGGVVNLYTWTPPTHREWAVEADYGERAYAKGLVRYGDAAGDVRYVVQVFRKQGDGFRNMPFDATDLMAKMVFPTGHQGEATVKATIYDETSHTTYVGLTQPMFQQDPRQDSIAPGDLFGIRRYELSLHHEQPLGEHTTLRSTLFASALDLAIYQQDFDRDRTAGVDYARVVGPEGINGSAVYFRKTRSLRDRRYEVAGIEPQLEHRFATLGVGHRLVVGARAMADVARRRLAGGTSPEAET